MALSSSQPDDPSSSEKLSTKSRWNSCRKAKSAAGRVRERDNQRRMMLRSRGKRLDGHSEEEDGLASARDMVRILTRMSNRVCVDQANGKTNKVVFQQRENSDKKRKQGPHDVKLKDADISSASLTRSMEEDRGQSIRSAMEGGSRRVATRSFPIKGDNKVSGTEEGLEGDQSKTNGSKYGKRAGASVDAPSYSTGSKKGFTDRGKIARLKLAKMSLRGAYDCRGSSKKAVKQVAGIRKRLPGMHGVPVFSPGPMTRGRQSSGNQSTEKGNLLSRCSYRNTEGPHRLSNIGIDKTVVGRASDLAPSVEDCVVLASGNQTPPLTRKQKCENGIIYQCVKGPVTRGMHKDIHGCSGLNTGSYNEDSLVGKTDAHSTGYSYEDGLVQSPLTGKSHRCSRQEKRAQPEKRECALLTRSKRKRASKQLQDGEGVPNAFAENTQQEAAVSHEVKKESDLKQQAAGVLTRSKRRRTMDCLNADQDGSNSEYPFMEPMMLALGKENVHCSSQNEGHAMKGFPSSVWMAKVMENDAERERQQVIVHDSRVNLSNTQAEIESTGPALELVQSGGVLNNEDYKVDPKRNSCLVTTTIRDTGRRQMRPRPLDLEQPMPILMKGRDQDYYDIDGSSASPLSLQHLADQLTWKCGGRGCSGFVTPRDGEGKPIMIPSFRVVHEYEKDQGTKAVYHMPQSYIKACSGTSNVHGNRAEYDMDDEDMEWLNNYNQWLLHSGDSLVLSEDKFEKIIDLLENKAADLQTTNLIPSGSNDNGATPEQASEDCCICNGGENSPHNVLFSCARCHINVHQSCYGIQECHAMKNWYCRKCEAVEVGTVNADVGCALCCKQGGALKPATEPDRWVHVVCALYTNETYFVNADAMEPVDGLSAADSRVRKQHRRCCLCGLKEGSAERCSVPTCKAVFHVSCGVHQGASFELQHYKQQIVYVKPFCPKHASTAPVSSALVQELTPMEDTRLTPALQDNQRRSSSSSSSKKKGRKRIRRRKRTLPRKGSFNCEVHAESCPGTKEADDEHDSTVLKHEMAASDNSNKNSSDRIEKEISFEGQSDMSMQMADPFLSLADVPETDIASREVVEAVYWYWAFKRARCGGPLLHHIRQEWAVEYLGIFNPNTTNEDASLPKCQGRALRQCLFMKRKVVAARLQLQKLQELTDLIIKRERLKLEIFLIDQNIAKLSCHAVIARGKHRATARGRYSGQKCPCCKELTGLLLQCTLCKEGSCLKCFKTESGGELSWLDALKLTNFTCVGCQNEHHEDTSIAHEVTLPDTPYGDVQCPISTEQLALPHHAGKCGGDCLAGDGTGDGCGENAPTHNSHKKPIILFPCPRSLHEDKAVNQAFIDSLEHTNHPRKTVLVSQLLERFLHNWHDDAPKKHLKIPRRT